MFIETNVDFVRGIASWKPITDKGGKSTLPLGMVAFIVENDKVTVTVTDKYRLVYAVIDGDYSDSAGKTFAVPMSLFTRFVLGCKNVGNGLPVRLEIMGSSVMSIEGAGLAISEELFGGSYPTVTKVIREWVVGDSSELLFDMALVSDVVKLGNPFERFDTVGKRNNSWRMVSGGMSKAVRFDRGVPEKFGVLVQPNDPVFYVNGNGYEFVYDKAGARYAVFRNGDMRINIRLNEGDEWSVLRYTQDLEKWGITTDEQLDSWSEQIGLFEWVDNAWFEIDSDEDTDYESVVYHNLSDAITECKRMNSDGGK